MRKPPFCICDNKGADQLNGDRAADQQLCFRFIDSMIPFLPLLWLYSPVCVGPGRKHKDGFSHDATHIKIWECRMTQ